MANTDKRERWQHHIDAWQRSDLSQKAYCESQGISLASFGYWRKRLADKTATKKLVAVSSAPAPSIIRIHLRGGILLEVPASSLAVVLPLVCQAVQVHSHA